MKRTSLNPGPSELYFTVAFHLKQALRSGIPTISHRSNEFQAIYASIKENLSTLLGLPEGYKIFFTSSVTEVWERIAQNLISKQSFHFSNGAFGDKCIDIVKMNGMNVEYKRAEEGSHFDVSEIRISEDSELISITQNETSTGTRFPLEDIKLIRDKYPNKIIAIDAASSLPYEQFDFDIIDTLYFSVQKCFGLPPGLGVWLVNDRCIEKAWKKQSEGAYIGTYHSIPRYIDMYNKNQTPETPNTLNIYLLSKVIEDMLQKGMDIIRRETNYKAAVIYQSIENSKVLDTFVKNKDSQSKTVIVAETSEMAVISDTIKSKGFICGEGYGRFKNSHIRIANFPTHSKESFEKLADIIKEL